MVRRRFAAESRNPRGNNNKTIPIKTTSGKDIANTTAVTADNNNNDFYHYLIQRTNAKTAAERVRYARKFVYVLESGDAQSLLQLSGNVRVHTMKALASLARFTGQYDRWMQIRQRYNLKWSTGNETLATFQKVFDSSNNLDTMLTWVKEAISVLPPHMGEAIKFNCITGLRPIEAIHAIELIRGPDSFKSYYNDSNKMLEHFRYPNIFLRRTKVAYITLIERKQLSGIDKMRGKTPTYTAIRFALTRKGVGMHMAYCRKIYASWLSQNGGIQPVIIDLLQGFTG